MGMRNLMIATLLVTGCGAPLLHDAPHFDSTYVAGSTAVVATALTVLDPDGQARNVEQAIAAGADDRPMPVHDVIPEDVFDRLER
jgi:hypothetical protein